MTFGERLQAAREAAGLNREELAERAGMSSSTVKRLEEGDRKPLLETAQTLARALGVGLLDLAGDAQEEVAAR